ncbi:MAG: hypothetical protein ACC661_03455 [Verrucomicrobiales bacterium]
MSSSEAKHGEGLPLSRKVLFSGLSLALFFGLLEAGSLFWERWDPLPNSTFPEASRPLPPKEEGEFRVLLYGGSTVAGWPVPEMGFAAQMQDYLEQIVSGRRIRLVNYAVSAQPSTYVLRKLNETLAAGDADAVVVLTAHNEFMLEEDLSVEDLDRIYAIQESLSRLALVRRIRRLLYRVHISRRSETVMNRLPERVDRNSPQFRDTVALYENNLGLIVRLARGAGVPLFLCTGPANLVDWPPSMEGYPPYAGIESHRAAVENLGALLSAAQWQSALAQAEAALVEFPEEASLHYGAGRALMNLGRMEGAHRHFLLASDLDVFPYRALTRFNELIRNMAGRPGVRVVDLARVLGERSRYGLPGWEMIFDSVHPSPKGNFLVATALIDALARDGLVEFTPPAEALVSLEDYAATGDRVARWVAYLLRNARIAMGPPDHHFKSAGRFLERAVHWDPGNWEVLANVATLVFLQGDVEAGKVYLEKAARLRGSPIDPGDRELVPYLKEALEGAGL